MTSNQRRPGFRLPWGTGPDGTAPEEDASAQSAVPAEDAQKAAAKASPAASLAAAPPSDTPAATQPSAAGDETPAPAEASTPTPTAAEAQSTSAADEKAAVAEPTPAPSAEVESASTAPVPAVAVVEASARPADTSAGFMRDLVAAMRRVAEETRQSGLSDLRTKAEEQVRTLEADAEHRRDEQTARAERDVAAIGEWAKAETERIATEAEQRKVARRAELDQQLAAEATRAEAEAQALRDRVAAYERELDAYHAQLSDIADPAAFAAAAKKMPTPPRLDTTEEASELEAPAVAPVRDEVDEAPADATMDTTADATTGAADAALAARLAELEASEVPAAASAEPTATEVRVKGLGSFGAITGFRQALAGADGIEGVSLSLGPTGEFVFRALHPAGFDVAAAIAKIEGDGATIEAQPDGGLGVTLARPH